MEYPQVALNNERIAHTTMGLMYRRPPRTVAFRARNRYLRNIHICAYMGQIVRANRLIIPNLTHSLYFLPDDSFY